MDFKHGGQFSTGLEAGISRDLRTKRRTGKVSITAEQFKVDVSVHFEFCAAFFVRRGAFSIVRRCVHKETRVEYAAKIINTRKLSSRGKKV